MRDERLRRFLKAMGDKTRFDVVEELGRNSECSVTELSLTLGVTQPLMSWHVRMLRSVGVISTRRQGRQVFCSLNRQSFAAYRDRLDALIAGRTPAPDMLEPLPAQRAPLPS
ncbi:MAG: metalloregulator ArsR/SmtB family transcription factor [Chloroflexota bacterium]|nr:metalloregulator ArsR/SmtB family transcription factor [Chloroflexota bacterium]